MPLLGRAVRSRPAIQILLLLLATLAVATTALGPLLVRAAAQSALADAVADADPRTTAVETSVRLPKAASFDASRQALAAVLAAADQGPDGGFWTSPSYLISSTVNLDWSVDGTATSSRMNVPEVGCAGYVLTSGRCPNGQDEAMISSADAARTRVDLGGTLAYRFDGVSSTRLRVVGSYDADASLPGQLVRPGSAEGSTAAVTGDPVIITAARLKSFQQLVSITARIVPAHGIGVDQEPTVRSTLVDVQDAARRTSNPTVFYESVVGALLDRVDAQTRQGSVLITVTVVQAAAVAFFALGVVLQRLGRSRAAEWGIGRLRGIPRRRWWSSIVVEPGLALLLGLPLGVAVAAGAARLAVDATLRRDTPIDVLGAPVLLAATAALVAAVAILLAVAAGLVRRPTVDLIQGSAERRRLGPLAVLGQVVVLSLAAAALYQLLSQDQLTSGGSQLGLLAPALLALAAALVAVRVVGVVVRRVTRRPPRGRLSLVVGRQLGRMPSALNPAVVVAAAMALTVFAGQVLLLSARNQDERARALVGAATVLQVAVPKGENVADLVRAADPTGRYAMGVQERAASADGSVSRIVAVDSPRFDAVTSWDPAWGGGVDVGALATGRPSPVLLRGTELAVTLSDTTVTARAGLDPYTQLPRENPDYGNQPPSLSVYLQAPFLYPESPPAIFLGPLRAGTVTYRAPIPCADGCRLAALALRSQVRQGWETSFTLSSVATDQQPADTLAARLRTPDWTGRPADLAFVPQFREEIGAQASDQGVRVTAADEEGNKLLRLEPGDARDPVPTLLGPTVDPRPAPARRGVVVGAGLDGRDQWLAPLGRAAVLPRSLDDGLLVDLNDLQGLSDPREAQVLDEVWLAPNAPATVETALLAAGVTVTARESVADTSAALRRQPTTRGAAVAQVVGYAALALAVLTLLAARLADLNGRRRSWRSLREAGIARRIQIVLGFADVGAPAVLGVIIGAAAGVLATVLAAPRLPLTDTAVPGPPLDLALDWPPLLGLTGVALAVVLVLAVVVALVETRPTDQAGRR